MKLHANARLSVKGRELLIDRVLWGGWLLMEAAEAAGISDRTAAKWVGRFRAEGVAGLADRSSVPTRQPTRTPEDRVQAIAALRRVRLTGWQIAVALEMPLSTVSGILTRIGLGKLSRLEPPEPANRYERRMPGELIHIDVKKLGRITGGAGHRVTGNRGPGQRSRGAGWEYVHVCVDDATRLAYVEVLADEKAITATLFLRRAVAFYRRHGVRVQRVMTDNGPAYVSLAHKLACTALGLKHLRTRPYRPRTNGKAERFIRTMLGGWAYGAIYRDSSQRTAALSGWLEEYNYRRPHGSLSHKPPGTRLNQLNNLHRSYN
ncbi:MAG: IS481 family transposase [Solirubrobacteraceae bacterium]